MEKKRRVLSKIRNLELRRRLLAGSLAFCFAFVSCPVQVFADMGESLLRGDVDLPMDLMDGKDISSLSDNHAAGENESKPEREDTEAEDIDTQPEGEEAPESEEPETGEEDSEESEKNDEDDEDCEENDEEEEDIEEYPIPEGTVRFRYDKNSHMYSAVVVGQSGVRLQVSYAEGVFSDKAVLDATEITNTSAIQKIEDCLSDEDGNAATELESISFDIKILTFTDDEWTETQPDTSVGYPLVSFSGNKISEAINDAEYSVQIYHVADSVEQILDTQNNLELQEMQIASSEEKEEVTFYAPHFSSYAILLTKTGTGASLELTSDFTGEIFGIDGIEKFDVSVKMVASAVDNPDLVITIPKGVGIAHYPTHESETLSQYLRNGGDSVERKTDSDGNTVLTYQFKSNTSAIGFNITLQPTLAIKDGTVCVVSGKLMTGDIEKDDSSFSLKMKNLSIYDPMVVYGSTTDQTFADKVESVVISPNIRLYVTYINHYPFDSIEVVIPVTEGAEAGYLSDNVFTKFSDGETRKFENGSVTYHKTWESSKGAVLVYKLEKDHPLVVGNEFSYYNIYSTYMGSVRYRFSEEVIKAKMGENKSCSFDVLDKTSKSKVVVDDKSVEQTHNNFSSSVNFKIEEFWPKNFYLNASLSSWPVSDDGFSNSKIVNLEDCSYYSSTIRNSTGKRIENLVVEYKFDERCYANRVKALTSSATVSYRTKNNNSKIQTEVLTSSNNEFQLSDKEDAIVWMKVTYDNIGNNNFSDTRLLSVYVVNRGNLDGVKVNMSGKILSAKPSEPIHGVENIGEQTEVSKTCTLVHKFEVLTPQSRVKTDSSLNVLNKGESFTIQFYNVGSAPYSNLYMDDPTYYILMPRGYIYGGYTRPAGYDDVTVSRRDIDVDEETSVLLGEFEQGKRYVPKGEYILYTVACQGTNLSSGAVHELHFTVGLEIYTPMGALVSYLPSMFLATQDNELFPYNSNPRYQAKDLLDFNGNGDTDETMAKGTTTDVKINAEQAISIQGFSTSESVEGAGKSKEYQHKSAGTYEYYLYNGLGSSNVAKDIEVIIRLPQKGSTIEFNKVEYTSTWDGVLTGVPSCRGDALEDASISYSNDNGVTYNYNPANKNGYGAVTHVKISSAKEKYLAGNQLATISLPFEADFGEEAISSSSKAYINANTSYVLDGDVNRTSIDVEPCTLNASATPIFGHVYQDYDGDLQHDEDGKSYPVTLYEGEYTSGEDGLVLKDTSATAAKTGAYTNSTVFSSGYYTIKVEKSAEETFLPDAGWQIEGNEAYYTFQLTGEDSKIEWELYVIKPRILSVEGFDSGDYLYDTDTNVYTILATTTPTLNDDEELEFTSSNIDAVSVDVNGTLKYVGEGDALIKVRAPQLEAYKDVLGEWLEEEILVRARQSRYDVFFYTDRGEVQSADLNVTDLGGGTYAGTYAFGSVSDLPIPESVVTGEGTYYFAGWYDNAEKTGSTVTAIENTDSGKKEYWAKWQSYEVMYETSAGEWEYSSFLEAIDDVFDGGQIKFLASVSLAADVNIEKTIILKADGNNRMIQCNEHSFAISNGGALTIDDDQLMLTGNQAGGLLSVKDTQSQAAIYHGIVGNQGSGYAVSSCGKVQLSGEPYLTGAASIYLFGEGLLDITGTLAKTSRFYVKVDEASPGKIISTVSGQDYSQYFVSADKGYHIVYSSQGTLILQKKLTVKPESGQMKYYGGADPVLAYQLSEEADMSGQLGREQGEDAGTYQYVLGTLTAGERYYLVLDNKDEFLIRPQIVIVKPADVEKRAGEKNPAFSLERVSESDEQSRGETETLLTRIFASNKMEPADDLLSQDIIGVPVFSCKADVNSPEGQYPITILSMSGGSENYEVVYSGEQSIGTLTVLPGKLYRLSYEGGSKVKGKAPKAASYIQGTKVTLAKNSFTKAGYKFGGWEYGGKLYQSKAVFTMPKRDVVLKAKWEKTEPKPLGTAAASPQPVALRTLDNVPKTGQSNNHGTQQLSPITMWNHADCRKSGKKQEDE